jgi:hypothetical protein
VDLLDDLAIRDPGLAKLEAPVTIDRSVSVADHRHEDVWIAVPAFDAGRGKGVRRRRVVAAKRFFLGLNDGLAGGDIIVGVGESARSDQDSDQ